MRVSKIVDENTIKTGPIKQKIDGELLSKIYNSSRFDNKEYQELNLIEYEEDIAEGCIYASLDNRYLIYKISPKMISQHLFSSSYNYLPEERECMSLVWDKPQYNYYIPELYFIERGGSFMIMFVNDTFFPILNMFTSYPCSLEHINFPKTARMVCSELCVGRALADMDIGDSRINRQDKYSAIFNRILSASSNSDLVPSSNVCYWREDLTYGAKSVNFDFMLRCVSNLSEKLEIDEYLEVLKEAQFHPSVIFNKVIELGEYTDEEEQKLRIFFRANFY